MDRPNSQTCMVGYHVCVAYFVWICHKYKRLPLRPTQPSSPSTKEIHALAYLLMDIVKKIDHRSLDIDLKLIVGV